MHVTTSPAAQTLPYWQVNVPVSERQEECPQYLCNIRERAKRILEIPSSQFRRLPWNEARDLVITNRIDGFQREPTELRRYYRWRYGIVQQYGSITDYVLQERLQWSGQTNAKGRPFEEPSDVKILYNDWPYGIDHDIVHLVVWTKFELQDDEMTGDLANDTRAMIDSFVEKTFRSKLSDVVWFRNWKELKSVGGIEHFHVLINRPDPKIIARLTNDVHVKC